MEFIYSYGEIMYPMSYENMLRHVERAGRTCYKSEDSIKPGSAEKFVSAIVRNGHEAVLEHGFLTVRFVTSRGLVDEILRHRTLKPPLSEPEPLLSPCVESTRYCNYSKDKFGRNVIFVMPYYIGFDKEAEDVHNKFVESCRKAEEAYLSLIDKGVPAEIARDTLPLSVKSECVLTGTIRAWRDFFRLRTGKGVHQELFEITGPLLGELSRKWPAFFADIYEKNIS